MTLEELNNKEKELRENTDKLFNETKKTANESKRVAEVAGNAENLIAEIEQEFEAVTKLDKKDSAFLFVATALQIARQYLLTQFPERLDDQTAAQNTILHQKEHSNRHHTYYNPSLAEIISNPVPFDANIGANGALSGGGKMGHRVTALGHDPLLGLIVGTCNIATSTLTNNRLESFHITTGINNKDVFRNRAQTGLVFQKTGEKLLEQGASGKILVGTSLLKEIVHLKSDVNTKHSLPFPIISAIDGNMASKLADYGLDMANIQAVTKQASISILINTLIAMIHGAFYIDNLSKSEYEVKTRKILSYSNLIASTSNLIFVGGNMYAGNKDAIKYLDIGGLLVTCYRVATDSKFIAAAKKEFLEKKFFAEIHGTI